MKTNTELRATLNMVVARLNNEARPPYDILSHDEWEVIRTSLGTCLRYATKKVKASSTHLHLVPPCTCSECNDS
jgi:hypothetical protein